MIRNLKNLWELFEMLSRASNIEGEDLFFDRYLENVELVGSI